MRMTRARRGAEAYRTRGGVGVGGGEGRERVDAHVYPLVLELLEDGLSLRRCEIARVRTHTGCGRRRAVAVEGLLEELEKPHEARRRLGRLGEDERVPDLVGVYEVEEHEGLRGRVAHDHVFLCARDRETCQLWTPERHHGRIRNAP